MELPAVVYLSVTIEWNQHYAFQQGSLVIQSIVIKEFKPKCV